MARNILKCVCPFHLASSVSTWHAYAQIQFNIRGSGGVGIVYADMFQDASKQWQYTYLYVDIPEHGKKASQRLAIVTPPLQNVTSSL